MRAMLTLAASLSICAGLFGCDDGGHKTSASAIGAASASPACKCKQAAESEPVLRTSSPARYRHRHHHFRNHTHFAYGSRIGQRLRNRMGQQREFRQLLFGDEPQLFGTEPQRICDGRAGAGRYASPSASALSTAAASRRRSGRSASGFVNGLWRVGRWIWARSLCGRRSGSVAGRQYGIPFQRRCRPPPRSLARLQRQMPQAVAVD